MDKRYGRHHGHGSPVLGPVLMIAAGVVFLLNNLGVLPWSIWGQLWRLWPLVLVAIGLDMLFGRRSALLSLVIAVGVLGAGAGVLYYTGGLNAANIVRLPVKAPLFNATSANVTINTDGGDLTLGGLVDSNDQLASGTLEYYDKRGEPTHELTMSDSGVMLRFEQHNKGDFPTFNFGGDSSPRWDVLLTMQIPLTLILDVGDGNSTLDLTNLRATHLDLHSKDGNIRFTAPENAGSMTGTIEIADGNIDIAVPKSVASSIHIEKGDGNIHKDSEFNQDGDTYTTLGSADSKNKLELTIKMKDGNVNLRSK